MSKNIKSSIVLCLLACAGSSSAAVVTWGTAVNLGSNFDTNQLITGNTVVISDHDRSSNAGWYAGTTSGDDLTGVTFYDGSTTAGNTLSTFTAANLQSALDSYDWGNNANTTQPIYVNNVVTYGGLTEGLAYKIQLFFSRAEYPAPDPGNPAADTSRTFFWNDGNGNIGTISSPGQYVIGTFVADNTGQQQFFGSGVTGAGGALGGDLSMSVLAQVPEPSSAALLGLGAFAFVVRRRR